MDILDRIESGYANIDSIREKMIKPQLIPLITNLEGYNNPVTFGVYRDTGGDPLGVVGSRYSPMDLNVMLDSIVESVGLCGDLNLDLNTLKYNEYCGGSKVSFSIDLPAQEIIGSPMVGDIVKRRLEFRTGFDGLTKSSITEYYYRLWCKNGASSPFEQNLSFKNTIGNHIKIYNLCSHIASVVKNGDEFLLNLGELAKRKITKLEREDFIKKVLGQSNPTAGKEVSTRSTNITAAVEEAIQIEINNTGENRYSLLQGLTRYVSHNRANQSEEDILYGSTSSRMIKTAMQLVLN